MPKASMMESPLGFIFRDITVAERKGQYYLLTLRCGHTTKMSRQSYEKYHKNTDNSVVCIKCDDLYQDVYAKPKIRY